MVCYLIHTETGLIWIIHILLCCYNLAKWESVLYFILNKSIPCGSKQEILKTFSSLKPWNLHISHSFSFCLILVSSQTKDFRFMVTLWLDSWPFRVKPRSFSLPFSPHFFLSFLPPVALIEVLFVYHKIQLFYMHNSVIFKWIFSVVQLFPQPNVKHCHHPKKEWHAHVQSLSILTPSLRQILIYFLSL